MTVRQKVLTKMERTLILFFFLFLFREVLWHASMDMLAFILPLINTAKIKNYISKWIPTKGY